MIAALLFLTQMQAPTQVPVQVPMQRSTQRNGIQFITSVSADTMYAGAQFSYDGIMRINATETIRFLDPPAYTPPTMSGAVVYSIPLHARPTVRDVRVGTATFKEYRYHHVIFPLTSGLDTVSATTLRFTRLDEKDPYGSTGTTLQSPARTLVVLPLPTQGRPRGFSGAVGQLTISMALDTNDWHVGEGTVVRARVSGTGNLPIIPRPALDIPWATVLATTDSVAWDSTGVVARGFREFRWLVTPQAGGQRVVPAVRYSAFDPTTARYVTSTTTAIPVRITGGTVPSHDTVSATPLPTLIRVVRQYPISVILIGIALVLAGVAMYRILHLP